MISLPLLPVWIIDFLGSAVVICLAWGAFRTVQHLMAKDPDNPQWLFLFWFTLALLVFALCRSVAHILRYLLVFSGQGAIWEVLQPFSGGLNTIAFVAIAAVSLFFHHIQLLYRRIAADHQQLEHTSREILALNREMETLVMERTMSEMALGMADGIRNPLHIIGGFSHRLVKKAAPEDPARAWAAAIAKEAQRLEKMVERFEALAKRKESFFVQTDLNDIIREVIEMLDPEFITKDIRLQTTLHPQPIFSRVNVHLLKVALAHLLRNAIEATAPGGEISLSTFIERSFGVAVIQDTGRGMLPEVVEKVFVPFYTTKIGGTGLGMVFVRQIIDEHRGVITLDSQVGRGTSVIIKVPLRLTEAPLADASPD